MAFQLIINSEEELSKLFVSPSQVARETGWNPSYVSAMFAKYRKRGTMVAGKPAYFRSDLDEILVELKRQQDVHPMAPSILDQLPGQAR